MTAWSSTKHLSREIYQGNSWRLWQKTSLSPWGVLLLEIWRDWGLTIPRQYLNSILTTLRNDSISTKLRDDNTSTVFLTTGLWIVLWKISKTKVSGSFVKIHFKKEFQKEMTKEPWKGEVVVKISIPEDSSGTWKGSGNSSLHILAFCSPQGDVLLPLRQERHIQ